MRWVLLILLLSVLLAQVSSLHHQRQQKRHLAGCRGNLKEIATALEMYASGPPYGYPPTLSHLLPGTYLKTIPMCPAAQRDSYSGSYEVASRPDAFTLKCLGDHHGPQPAPSYNASEGLVPPD